MTSRSSGCADEPVAITPAIGLGMQGEQRV